MRRAGALAALVTAAMEAGKLREAAAAVTGTQSWCAHSGSGSRRLLKLGDSGNGGRDAGRRRASLGGGEYEVAIWTTPLGLNKRVCGSRKVSCQISLF